MKMISERDFNNRIREISHNYPNSDIFNHWEKTNIKYIFPINCALYVLYGVFLAQNIDLVYFALNVKEDTPQLFVCLGIIAMISIMAMTIIHELIHIFILPHKIKTAVIVYKFPVSLSVEHCIWLRKYQKLLVLISPVLIISIFLVPFFIMRYFVLGCWLVILNISLSWSDIFSFFYIFKTSRSKHICSEIYIDVSDEQS